MLQACRCIGTQTGLLCCERILLLLNAQTAELSSYVQLLELLAFIREQSSARGASWDTGVLCDD